MSYPKAVRHEGKPGTVGKTHYEWVGQGCTLADREQNYHDDSDFYVLQWNPERRVVEQIGYGTTRCIAPTQAHVDATDEVVEEAARWAITEAFARARAEVADEIRRHQTRITKGAKVKVVRGRKVAKGTVGFVAGVLPNAYQESNRRVRLQVDGELLQTYERNLEVVEPAPREADYDVEHEIQREAREQFGKLVGRWAIEYSWKARKIWSREVDGKRDEELVGA